MLALSPLEAVELIVWAIGVVAALRLFRSPAVDRVTAVVLHVLALELPVLGAVGVPVTSPGWLCAGSATGPSNRRLRPPGPRWRPAR